jgi:hypothetical protein
MSYSSAESSKVLVITKPVAVKTENLNPGYNPTYDRSFHQSMYDKLSDKTKNQLGMTVDDYLLGDLLYQSHAA